MLIPKNGHRFLYFVLLAGIGGAAAIRVFITLAESLLHALGMWGVIASACPVPIICIFDDPLSPVIEVLFPSRNFPGTGHRFGAVFGYQEWHGPFIVAMAILALALKTFGAGENIPTFFMRSSELLAGNRQ